jgi:hypothetical protein
VLYGLEVFSPSQFPTALATKDLFLPASVCDNCKATRAASFACSGLVSVYEALAPGQQTVTYLVNQVVVMDTLGIRLVEPPDFHLSYSRRPRRDCFWIRHAQEAYGFRFQVSGFKLSQRCI